MRIDLPNNGWKPRPKQERLWNYLHNGGKRALAIWHRRYGKDEVALNWAACAAFERVGGYWHMLPEASQARKAIWEAINPHTGIRRIDEAFPIALRETTRENEMFIKFKNGSTWQVVGSDNFESLIGSPPIGITVSEWAIADPKSWAMLRPILAENNGWILFITTPRGKNHAYRMYEYAKTDPRWFCERLSVDDTGAIDKKILEDEKREMMEDYGAEAGLALYRQEYMSSFESAVVGSYYGDLVIKAEQDGRITKVPYTPGASVITGWDLGIGDSTVIWFAQIVGKEPRLIDCYEASGVGLDHYVKLINSKDYNYQMHFLPHDAGHASLRTGKTLAEQLIDMGISKKQITVLNRTDVEAGIAQVRTLLKQAWMDEIACIKGLEALKAYRRKWDDKNKVFSNQPLHDWSSDYCDALRYLAVGLSELKPIIVKNSEPEYGYCVRGADAWMA
jgi:hypothetical protein